MPKYATDKHHKTPAMSPVQCCMWVTLQESTVIDFTQILCRLIYSLYVQVALKFNSLLLLVGRYVVVVVVVWVLGLSSPKKHQHPAPAIQVPTSREHLYHIEQRIQCVCVRERCVYLFLLLCHCFGWCAPIAHAQFPTQNKIYICWNLVWAGC